MFPGFDQPTKKPCLFQPTTFPNSTVEWYQPPSGWFNMIREPAPPRPLKRGRDSMDDLTASMKRLRTDSESTEDDEAKEDDAEDAKEKEKMSTALVVSRPTPQCRLLKSRQYSPDPDYSLPPPMGSFPVVLYKGPPSPSVGPSKPRRAPTREWEELSLLSKDNRTLKVSPSMTIELVDDDEDEALPQTLGATMLDETPMPRTGPTMTDDD